MRILGIDVGGTNIKYVLWDSVQQKILRKASINYTPATLENFLITLDQILFEIKIKKIGIAIPGTLDLPRETVIFAPNLIDWNVVPLKGLLESKYGLSVTLENDANAAAYGEYYVGAGRSTNGIVLLTLGTGVGGGVVLHGKLMIGANGGGAELGHYCIDENGFPCNCGANGCLEQYASINGIIRLGKLYDPYQRMKTPEEWSELANNGDPFAIELWEKVGHFVGLGVSAYVNIFHPSKVLIGGGIANANEKLIIPIRNTVLRRSMKSLTTSLKIEKAELGDFAGAVGVALLATKKKRVFI